MRGWRYPLALVALLLMLAIGAVIAFRAVEGIEQGVAAFGPWGASPGAGAGATGGSPAGAAPRPDTSPAAPADTSTEVTAAAPAPARDAPTAPPASPSPPPPWRPSPRQAMQDTVFRLRQAGRDAEALAVLARWLAAHPDDRAMRLEAARLSLQQGDLDGAWRDYDALVAAGAGTAVEEEYAAALLARGRHLEAARRYERLLARDPSRDDWRLAAARGLAWDGRPRDALRVIGEARGGPRGELLALQRVLRAGVDPTAAEAAAWVAADSTSAGYWLALARALAREGRPAEAIPAYERALRDGATLPLLSEAAGVAASAGDSASAARLLGAAVALAPTDAALRERYAEALAWSGDRRGAIAEYDRLIAAAPTAALLRARARLRVQAGDETGAIADLTRAEALAPTVEGQVLLGDLYRWRGDATASRAAYERALALDPAAPDAAAGLALLRTAGRRDRPWDAEEGTSVTAALVEDNTGFGSRLLRAQHGLTFGATRRTIVSAGVEYRGVLRGQAGYPGAPRVDGWGGDVGVAQELGRARVGGRLGLLTFGDVPDLVTWSATAEAPLGASHWRAVVARGPAYETLRAGATLGAALPASGDTALAGTSAALTVIAPLGRLELWSRAEYLGLDDGNRRPSIQVALRAGLGAQVNLVYAGGLLGFRDPVAGYWSPRAYSLQSLGVEYRRKWPSGAFVTGQALPGLAFYDEAPPGQPAASGTAFQWQLAGEGGWATDRWDLGATAAWGRERRGTYEAVTATLRARYRW